jgi:hypothetical protein
LVSSGLNGREGDWKLILKERVGKETGVAWGGGVVQLDIGCGVQGATK